MDNTTKRFAQKIVSELEGIKGLIIDVVSSPRQKRYSTQENKDKPHESTDKQKEIATTTLPSNKSTEIQPAITAERNTKTENKERFPRLTQWKPVFEIIGLMFLVAYTTIAAFQWRATMEANRISGDTAQRQLRAYLGAEPTLIENFKPGFTTSISFKVDNFGQTPAYSVTSYSHADVLPYPFPVDSPFPFNRPLPADAPYESSPSIYPHLPLPTGVKMDHPLTDGDTATVLDGTKARLYAGGVIHYRDIFGVGHCTRFFMSTGGAELVSWIKSIEAGRPSGSPWRWSSQYNDDDKCEAQK